MMQSFDDNMLAGAPARPPAPPPATDHDPFANISLDAPSPPAFASPPSTGAGTNVLTIERVALKRNTGAQPSASPPPTSSAPPPTPAPPPRASREPSVVAVAFSWALLIVSGVAAGGGIAFAGWTSEALDLDAALMPTFETTFGVTPPRSFTGRDDVPLDVLRRAAQGAEASGDLASAAVLWKEIQSRDPADKTASAAVPRVLTALGERLR